MALKQQQPVVTNDIPAVREFHIPCGDSIQHLEDESWVLKMMEQKDIIVFDNISGGAKINHEIFWNLKEVPGIISAIETLFIFIKRNMLRT